MISAATEEIETAEATAIKPTSQHLFGHLLDNGFIEPVRELDTRQLHVNPLDVLKMIQSGDAAWVDFVPPKAAAFIRREGSSATMMEPSMGHWASKSVPAA